MKLLKALSEEWIATSIDHHDPENLPNNSSTAAGRTPHHDPYRLSGDLVNPLVGKNRSVGRVKVSTRAL